MIKFFFSFSNMKFSDWLKSSRLNMKNVRGAKMPQEELAAELKKLGYEITGAQISNYEREYDKDKDGNPTRPPEKFVELAAKILHRDINEARTAAGYKILGINIRSVTPSLYISEIGSKFSMLEDADQIELWRIVDFLDREIEHKFGKPGWKPRTTVERPMVDIPEIMSFLNDIEIKRVMPGDPDFPKSELHLSEGKELATNSKNKIPIGKESDAAEKAA